MSNALKGRVATLIAQQAIIKRGWGAIAEDVVAMVLEEVSADLSRAADEVERATTLPTHNRAIAWALRSASMRYLAMAKEGT